MPSPGYSNTPLFKKLGIKPEMQLLVLGYDENYPELFDPWPERLILSTDAQAESIDFVHLFVRFQHELDENLGRAILALKKDGICWISWPKGTSGVETDLNRDVIREKLLSETDLVDIKVAAINETWSGLKFMWRKEKR